jgi:hypothetical protein
MGVLSRFNCFMLVFLVQVQSMRVNCKRHLIRTPEGVRFIYLNTVYILMCTLIYILKYIC